MTIWMNAWLSQALLCPHVTQHAGDSWLSLCPPSLCCVGQALSRTLSTHVDGSSLHPQCPPQIWTLARRQWGQEQKLLALVKAVVAPATPWPLPSNVPSDTHSLLRLLSSPRIFPSPPAFLTRPCFRRPTAQSLYAMTSYVQSFVVSPHAFVGPAFIEGYHMQWWALLGDKPWGQAGHPVYRLS